MQDGFSGSAYQFIYIERTDPIVSGTSITNYNQHDVRLSIDLLLSASLHACLSIR
jgi:hypothetical protein